MVDTYLNNRLLGAEAEPPHVVLVQFLDAQRKVGRNEPAAHTALSVSLLKAPYYAQFALSGIMLKYTCLYSCSHGFRSDYDQLIGTSMR